MKKIVTILFAAFLLTGMAQRPESSSLPLPEVITDQQLGCEISDRGLELVKAFEGYEPFIYADVAGYPTIGHGHLVKKGEAFIEPLLPEEAHALLKRDARNAEKDVSRAITIPIAQHRCDALVSLNFNIGNIKKAAPTLVKFVNQAMNEAAAKQFMVYVRAGGKVVQGLVRRRKAESNLYSGA